MVMVHGFGVSGVTWRPITPLLAGSFRCHAIDLPGHGRSHAPSAFNFTLEEHVAALQEYVIDSDLENVVLVGHSLGGTISTLSLIIGSEDYRRRIAALCIIDGVCYPIALPFFLWIPRVPIIGELAIDCIPAEVQVTRTIRACFFDHSKIDERQVRDYARDLKNADVRHAILQTAKNIDQVRLQAYVERIRDIRKPALLIWGRNDNFVPLLHGKRLNRDLTNSELVVLDRCGHMPQEERPEQTAYSILRARVLSSHRAMR